MQNALRVLRMGTSYVLLFAILFGSGIGCGNKPTPAPNQKQSQESPTLSVPKTEVKEKQASASKPDETNPLYQSFEEATRNDPPQFAVRPPDRTCTGKSVGKLYLEVKKIWPTIRFTDEAGQQIRPVAKIETTLGTIEIELRPDWAPNHVRNFIALSKVGYYDGLCFDRIHHEQSNLEQGILEHVEAGCTFGTGQMGGDSLGYWLKRELHSELSHKEGTVGACRQFEEDTSACKFYITLSDAPYLDEHCTIFGKVKRGMDIVRKMYEQPVIFSDEDVNGSRRPLKPVKMKKVTIETRKETPSATTIQ